MKYTVLGFQQQKLIDNELDLTDALILSVLRDVSLKFEKRIIKGKEYFWYKQGVLFEEIPIVGSEKTLDRRLDKLEEKGFISQAQKNSKKIFNEKTKKSETKKGTFKYFRVNEKVFELLDYQGLEDNPNMQGVDKMSSDRVDKMSSDRVDKMSSQRPSSLHLYPSSISSSSKEHEKNEEEDEKLKEVIELYKNCINKKITSKQKNILAELITIHGLETVKQSIEVTSTKATSPNIAYLKKVCINGIQEQETKTTSKVTSKNPHFTTTYTHNWDLEELEKRDRQFLEKKYNF